MKKLLLLLLISLTYTVNANGIGAIADTIVSKTSQTIDYVDTSSTFKQIYSDMKAGITALASSLKVGSTEVFRILVKQQLVNAITYLLLGIIALILLRFGIRGALNKDEAWMEDYDATPIGVIRILQLTIGVFFFIAFSITLDDIITGFINPEYGAIMDILKIINKQ